MLDHWPKDDYGTKNGLKPVIEQCIRSTNLLHFASSTTACYHSRIQCKLTGRDRNGKDLPMRDAKIEPAVFSYSGPAKITISTVAWCMKKAAGSLLLVTIS
ncbi:MAG: hypothetical protein M1835_001709 [Candelina submexicana]|nr:MAG: hypothetical protein M1835_001709 [Candelina submexicana]